MFQPVKVITLAGFFMPTFQMLFFTLCILIPIALMSDRLMDLVRAAFANWIYLAFLCLGLLHLTKAIQVDVYVIISFLIAGCPLILKLASSYMESIEVPGFKGTFQYGTVKPQSHQASTAVPSPQRSVEATVKVDAVNSSQIEAEKRVKLGAEPKKVLATIWHYQVQTFTAESPSRWGMSPQSQNPLIITAFSVLCSFGLLEKDLEMDLYFLTNKGIEYCESLRSELERMGPAPDYRFAPADEKLFKKNQPKNQNLLDDTET